MKRFRIFLAATFLPAAMLLPSTARGQALIGDGDLPPCFLQRNPISPTIYSACKSWKGDDGTQIFAAVGLPAARKRFWEEYANKLDKDNKLAAAKTDANRLAAAKASDEFKKASQEFADWLFLKDLNYLQAALRDVKTRDASDDPRDFIRMVNGLSLLGLGGSPILDGGIKQNLADEFYEWAKNVREKLGNPGGPLSQGFALGMMGPSIGKAIEASRAKYQRYVAVRDWEEFDAAGREPAGFDDPALYFPIMCVRLQKISLNDARSEYDGMLKALGGDAIRKAVQQVRAAPKASGGLLRVTAKEPITLTPSGNSVPDPSVPEPKAVIGAVSSPIQAVERLAIQGDDRRYLLWLLSRNRPSRSSTIDQATKWQYADATYRQFIIAFGEQDVLQASHQVRTATKRMTSGGVMDPAAIGATRPDPYPAFEDIVTRKNPRGYVRAIVAVKRSLKTAREVDEAYNNFVSTSGETAVLQAARKMAADKPNPNYDGDLDTLTRALNGSLSLEKPSVAQTDDPDYLQWKGFPSGAKVTYVLHGMLRVPPGSNTLVPGTSSIRTTYRMDSIDDKLAHLWRTEVVSDPDGKVHPPTDIEISYPAKIPQPATGARPAAATPLDNGHETLAINGRKIATRWQSVSSPYAGDCTMITTTWTSDEVPTGLVRKLQETRCTRIPGRIQETILESVEGFRSGSFGTPGSSPSASGSLPPPVSGVGPAGLSKTPAGKGPSQPPAASPVPRNAVVPNPAPSNQAPQSPSLKAVTPSTPVGSPAFSSRASGLHQRYMRDLTRFDKDINDVGQFAARTRTRLPADIVAARSRVENLIGAYVGAIRRGNYDQAEQDLQNAEAAAPTMEKFLGR